MTIQLWSTLLSLLVGALLGGVVNAAVSRYAEFKEAKGIARALHAEVQALVALVVFRRYGPEAQTRIARLTDTTHVLNDDDVFAVRITRDYFNVFSHTSGRLGLLPDLAHEVVSAYYPAQALMEEIAGLWYHRERLLEGKAVLQEANRQWLLDQTRQLSNLIIVTMNSAQALATRLEAFARRRWLGILP